MLRKISGSGFALAMIAIIALRLPVLGFCLCESDVIFNGEVCCDQAATQQSSCGCCSEVVTVSEEEPCRDCVVVLSLDPGDFQWSAAQFSPAQEDGATVALPVGLQDDLLPKSHPGQIAGSIRGSPPLGSSAVYFRSQVLRL
ncbi:MAG: hypothetical protein VCA35_17165 [Roseibacillus sp.]